MGHLVEASDYFQYRPPQVPTHAKLNEMDQEYASDTDRARSILLYNDQDILRFLSDGLWIVFVKSFMYNSDYHLWDKQDHGNHHVQHLRQLTQHLVECQTQGNIS